MRGRILLVAVMLTGTAHAQNAPLPASAASVTQLAPIGITARGAAGRPHLDTKTALVGPLGKRLIKDTPSSITVVPESLLVNQQLRGVNDALRKLPSVVIRDQQGMEVSRPQSRGFVSSVFQNTRMDGMNVIGTTAIPVENLSSIEVMNGMTGALFGPAPPSGVFNYRLKRPTDHTLARFTEGYNSDSTFTEHLDLGGRAGFDHNLGYRINLLHGQGTDYVGYSDNHRNLFSAALDYHFTPATVLETTFSHYRTRQYGLPGSVVYGGNTGSTVLPEAQDPTTPGLGQPGAGTDLISDIALAKLKHDFGGGWTFQIGALYEQALRHLYGITNKYVDDSGHFTVTKNFDAIPRYQIVSNLAQLNGHVSFLGTENDVTIASNGYIQHQFSYRNKIDVPLSGGTLAHPVVLSHPTVLPPQPTPPTGGRYERGGTTEQSLIFGDTMHFNKQWAVQAVLSVSWLYSRGFDKSGRKTSSKGVYGEVSPTTSLIYTPTPKLTTYFTWARSVQAGPSAPNGTSNAGEVLAPFHDTQYEVGAKYALTHHLLVTLAGFRMTQPLALTDPSNVFEVVGTQRNWGGELFAQGDAAPWMSVFGGVTYIDARLQGSTVPGTNGKLVVGVPHWKTDLSVDYHPAFLYGVALTGTVNYESRRAATDTNNSFAPDFATLNLGARYSLPLFGHPLTLRFQVENVTDTWYYSAIANGRIVGSEGGNTAYYGAPRTFMASVELAL